jgi:hypothetical protein
MWTITPATLANITPITKDVRTKPQEKVAEQSTERLGLTRSEGEPEGQGEVTDGVKHSFQFYQALRNILDGDRQGVVEPKPWEAHT